MDSKQMIEEASAFVRDSHLGKSTARELDRAILTIQRLLAVFEEVHTPTDDELLDTYNQAVDEAMHRANERDGFGSSMSRESIVSGLRAVAGFHRTVQGQPMCLKEHPITGARCSRPASPRHAHVCDLPGVQGEPSDAQELLAEADALVESWDRKGSWSSDSPVGMVMRLARALRASASVEGTDQ